MPHSAARLRVRLFTSRFGSAVRGANQGPDDTGLARDVDDVPPSPWRIICSAARTQSQYTGTQVEGQDLVDFRSV